MNTIRREVTKTRNMERDSVERKSHSRKKERKKMTKHLFEEKSVTTPSLNETIVITCQREKK